MTTEERKEYSKKYRQTHKQQIKDYRQSPNAKADRKKAKKKFLRLHKGYTKEYNKKYFALPRIKEYFKEYYKSPEKKKLHKENNTKYSRSLKGKETSKQYRQTHKESNKAYQKQYYQTSAGKEASRRHGAKRKQFGFVPLNKPFEGCEGHHINIEQVIYIPKNLHRSIWHSMTSGVGMDKINKIAFDYLELENKVNIN